MNYADHFLCQIMDTLEGPGGCFLSLPQFWERLEQSDFLVKQAGRNRVGPWDEQLGIFSPQRNAGTDSFSWVPYACLLVPVPKALFLIV